MAYTGHGHYIPGTIRKGIQPKQVSRCGGPRICSACALDAERAIQLQRLQEGKLPAMDAAEIEHRFGFHKATVEGENATLPAHREVRILFRELAERLAKILPDGRAKSVAFTELESASMWTHKSIAEKAPLIEEQDG